MNSSTSGVRLIALRFVLCLVLLQQTGNCMHLGNPFNKLKSSLKFGSCSGREQIHPEFRQMDEKEFKESVVDIFFPTKEVLRSRVAESHDEGAQEIKPLPDYYTLLKDTPEWQARITKIAGDSPELKNDERWPPKHVHPDRPVPTWRDIAQETLDTNWQDIVEFLRPDRYITESYHTRADGALEVLRAERAPFQRDSSRSMEVRSMDSWDQIKIKLKIDLGLLRWAQHNH